MNDFNTNLSSETVSRSKKNFMNIYNKMFEELASRGVSNIVSRAKCRMITDKRIKLSFFEREIVVDLNKREIHYLKGSVAAGEEFLDTYSSSLILHYLLNADGAQPAASWISYRELPGGLFYWQIIPKVLEPLIKKYENNGEGFLKKTFEIGGEEYAQFKFGSIIYPFKMFPVLMIFDEKSMEFEANVRVLFDGSAPHYLKTDVVKLIIIYIVKKLCR